MLTFTHRARANANASLISMVQRFSDITILFVSLYIVCAYNELTFDYKYSLLALAVLVVFQMIGGITDFYRSWRGVKISAELILIIKNWTLSLLFTVGLLSFVPDFIYPFKIFLEWYLLVTFGFVLCRTGIRLSAGLLRKLGYNTRVVAVAGSTPAGVGLLKGFIEEPWLGFVVKGIYDDTVREHTDEIPYCGDFEKLISDAKDGKIDRVYIALNMKDEAIIKAVVSQLTDTTCSVLLIPDIFTFNILQSRTEEINGVPVVPLFDTPLNGINMIFKRLEDIIVSLIILTVISPVLLLIACVVKFTSLALLFFVKLDMVWMANL